MRFHVTIRKRKISGSDIIKLTQLERNRTAIKEKIVEAALSVLPIAVIVLLLCLMVTPMRPDLLLCFLIGAVMLVVGMGLFSLGAEQSMTPIGSRIGTALTRTKNMPLILGVSFLLGFAITVAEPDLQVLAQTVPHIKSSVLLVTVGAGVGLFMAICMLRILTGASLRWILIVCYTLIFVLAAFTDRDFLCIAFDSGGVASGPMTATFMLQFVMGASIAMGGSVLRDAFGVVAMVAMLPLLSIQAVGFIYELKAKHTAAVETYGDFDIIELWEETGA